MSEVSIRKRFSLFKKRSQSISESKLPVKSKTFDESSINFELKGDSYNTNLIEACATLKLTPNEEMKLPLSCTWYRSTNEKQFVTIEGINGAFYQPTADDIGCKICVHAVPVSEIEEYTGMPAFNEIGPIQLHPEVQKTIQEMYEADNAEFTACIYGGSSENLTLGMVTVRVYGDNISLAYKDGNELVGAKLNMGYPKVSILHKTNTSFSINFENERIDLNADTHVDRDIIAIVIRMFSAKVCNENQADILIKIEQLSSRLLNLNKEHESAKTALYITSEELKTYKKSSEIDKQRIKILEEENSILSTQIITQSDLLERNDTELKFLRQDNLLYKGQCETLETTMSSQRISDGSMELLLNSAKEDINEILKKYRLCENCKRVERALADIYGKLDARWFDSQQSPSSSSGKSYQDECSESTEDHDREIKDFRDQILSYKCKFKQLSLESAELANKAEAEKNFYKRKADSLASENDKLLTKLGKNPKEIAIFAIERQDFDIERERMLTDLKQAQDHASNYERLGKINKKKLEEEIERNFELRKLLSKKSNAMNAIDYQKIINSLTMSVADREEEISQQKIINRELMNRIKDVELA